MRQLGDVNCEFECGEAGGAEEAQQVLQGRGPARRACRGRFDGDFRIGTKVRRRGRRAAQHTEFSGLDVDLYDSRPPQLIVAEE
jgi:hypothetical protein